MLIAACVEKRSKFLIRNMVESPGHFVMTSVVINGTSVLDPRKMVSRVCEFCRKEFTSVSFRNNRFCSRSCANKSHEKPLMKEILNVIYYRFLSLKRCLKKGKLIRVLLRKLNKRSLKSMGLKTSLFFRSF